MEANLKPDHNIIQPDPEPQPVAWEIWWKKMPEYRHLTHKCPNPNPDLEIRPLYATPSSTADETANPELAINRKLGISDSAGTVSVEAAVDAVMQLPLDEKRFANSWVKRPDVIAALRALAGEGGR